MRSTLVVVQLLFNISISVIQMHVVWSFISHRWVKTICCFQPTQQYW